MLPVRHHSRHQVPQAQLCRLRPRHRRPLHPEALSGEHLIIKTIVDYNIINQLIFKSIQL